ncbi:Hypothetical predicted protein [Cloeon dipterum]|uniref:Uncharacterized protein n=1 Tax=Cloeon dipterum TaxID=197152 RepID=A0A8S1DBN3_9INSE|nr:Hypothetical predicted protein [Cloeon dipterum]
MEAKEGSGLQEHTEILRSICISSVPESNIKISEEIRVVVRPPQPSGQTQHGPSYRQPQPGPSSGMIRPGFSLHPRSWHQFPLAGPYGQPLFAPYFPPQPVYVWPFLPGRPGPQPQLLGQSGIIQPGFPWQPQHSPRFPPGPFDRSQPGPLDTTQPGVSGQPRNSRQPQPEPCDESQPGPSSMTRRRPDLQQDVPKCVYCGIVLEDFGCFLYKEEAKKIPSLCPLHFQMGSPPKKKYLKETQDPKKICLFCTIYFRTYIKVCHFTGCDPGEHDNPYCERCVKSMEEAGRLEHVSANKFTSFLSEAEGKSPER